ncbi:hypothetical protein DPEC_G00065740 [Dallia pectoralis]|uniref:Uncharacterized protein n=1 Tax=Dallia pectoralis TaxID=75939 RepID=A0ACC2H873_DALPE|nr:hypothetical protein DPEC_G00065740 [Dallia pectoralis]
MAALEGGPGNGGATLHCPHEKDMMSPPPQVLQGAVTNWTHGTWGSRVNERWTRSSFLGLSLRVFVVNESLLLPSLDDTGQSGGFMWSRTISFNPSRVSKSRADVSSMFSETFVWKISSGPQTPKQIVATECIAQGETGRKVSMNSELGQP